MLAKLLLRENLSTQECKAAADAMLTGHNPYQTAAFLMLMRSKGETVDELLGFIEAMREKMVRVPVRSPVLDIVGTGGDGAHTLNISTASAILAASCGVKIAKHGNRSVSSLCGSADVLEALGIPFDIPPEQIARCIEEIGIGFCFAPQFHPALQQLKEVRKALSSRTLFNIIAPLLNPAHAQHFILGVFDEALLEIVATLLHRLNVKRSMVFHGCGLDELSCIGPAHVLEVSDQGIHRTILDPQEFGLKPCTLSDLQGKDARYNADKILEALRGKKSPFADTIALNAGVAIYLYAKAKTIQDGIEIAKMHLQMKKGEELLNSWRNHV
jgi:anthranilate phosphoribosyltransferase